MTLTIVLAEALVSFFTGNDLYEGMCGQKWDRPLCSYYVAGAADEAATAHLLNGKTNKDGVFCLPNGVTVGQIGDIFKKYLENNPSERNLDAPLLVLFALKGAFPCPSS